MREDKMMTLLGVLTAVMGALAMSVGKWIMGGVILLLSFGIFSVRGGGKVNDRSIYENVISSNLDIRSLFDKIKDMETPLGKPWIAEHKGYEGDSIVFGPSVFKDIVVVSKKSGKINIKHITAIDNIIRNTDDEWRFDKIASHDGVEVTPKRYSIYASFTLISVVMIKQLRELIQKISNGENFEIPSELCVYNFFYHNSHNGYFKDENENEILKVENSLIPFISKVSDTDGNEMASVVPIELDKKQRPVDSSGYKMYADKEFYADIQHKQKSASDVYTVKTEDAIYDIVGFPACRRANIASNYLIYRNDELKAAIGGSPNIEFDVEGFCQNDLVLSFDDDYLVLYAAIEVFIMTINKRFLK